MEPLALMVLVYVATWVALEITDRWLQRHRGRGLIDYVEDWHGRRRDRKRGRR